VKYSVLILLFSLSIFSVKAQDESKNNDEPLNQNLNEVKLNGFFLLAGAFEVTYEYLLNEESGMGISVMIPFDNNVRDDIQYYISPYYRFYFGEKYAAGFFAEGFGMLNSAKRELFEDEDSKYVTDFALGIGCGGKWINKRNFIFELSFGLGRNLFNNDEGDFDFVGKGGLIIGYRF